MNADIIKKAIDMGMSYAPKVAGALIALIVGLWIISKVTNMVNRIFEKQGIDETLRPFLTSLVSWILKLLLLISVASMIGIATTSFIAVMGAATLAIGMALQGSLGNFAGGVLLLIFRPFKVGDYISAQDVEGVVESIQIFATTVTSLDNQKIIIANGPLAGGTIKNVTGHDTRRVDLSVGVGYDDDVKKAMSTLTEMCKKHPKVLDSPTPFVGITEYGDSSINLTIRPWSKTSDYWDVFFDLNEQIKPCLDAAGISIPFPQRDVHMINPK